MTVNYSQSRQQTCYFINFCNSVLFGEQKRKKKNTRQAETTGSEEDRQLKIFPFI